MGRRFLARRLAGPRFARAIGARRGSCGFRLRLFLGYARRAPFRLGRLRCRAPRRRPPRWRRSLERRGRRRGRSSPPSSCYSTLCRATDAFGDLLRGSLRFRNRLAWAGLFCPAGTSVRPRRASCDFLRGLLDLETALRAPDFFLLFLTWGRCVVTLLPDCACAALNHLHHPPPDGLSTILGENRCFVQEDL